MLCKTIEVKNNENGKERGRKKRKMVRDEGDFYKRGVERTTNLF